MAGDKSNHVATTHLAQMLYLWPLFAFFSAPLILTSAISSLTDFCTRLAGFKSGARSGPSHDTAREPTSSSTSVRIVDFLISKAFYPCFLIGAAALSAGIVKYNTIVHPFTLADNRHYMFYVFRYTILRSQAIRLSLVAVYMASAHLVWSRLAGCPPAGDVDDIRYINRPFDSNTVVAQLKAEAVAARVSPDKTNSGDTKPAATSPEGDTTLPSAPPRTSTALLWLATTALSLVSAPLVEPRYFILPWVFWRLLVPAWTTTAVAPVSATPSPPPEPPAFPAGWLVRLGNALGRRGVFLETAWFVAVNIATFWVFLSRPYQWMGVDGRLLDEGRWQRFMW